VKALLVGGERSYRRKIREAVLSYRIEKKFSKDRVLEIYLNNLYLGAGAYGVEAAARVYFGKSVAEVTVAETAMLAGLGRSPSRDSPYVNFDRALGRQHYVLRRLAEMKKITWQEYTRFNQWSPLVYPRRDINLEVAPYFVEYIRQELVRRYGDSEVNEGGLEVYTTLSFDAQHAAEMALRTGLGEIRKAHDLPSPIAEADEEDTHACLRTRHKLRVQNQNFKDPGLTTAIVMKKTPDAIGICAAGYRLVLSERDSQSLLAWRGEHDRRLRIHDELLVNVFRVLDGNTHRLVAELPHRSNIQGALLSLDLETGAIRAMIGGEDFRVSQFNRATQARRQAGSAIKPLIYAAAIDREFHEMSLLEDVPIAVSVIGGVWEPKNYKREFLGPITLRTAFAKSINTVSVRLALALELQTIIDYFKRLGVTSPIPYHISVSLGTVDVGLMELMRTYAIFPRGGRTVEPYAIARIVGSDGVVLLEHETALPNQVLSSEAAYIMTDLMKAVTQFGTGRKAKDFPRPIGGKTGTSTDYRDAWFVGFTVDVITGVWVGRDDFMPIGYDATGGRVALPIWLNYMNSHHPATPIRDFEEPENIVWWPVDPWNGEILPPDDEEARMIPFKIGVEPDGRDSSRVDETRPKVEDEE
jgi:penicillin-binding protein 1A